MERSIPQLMVVGANALTLVSFLVMLGASVMFIISLYRFYRASKTKLRSDYSKAFEFSGHGFVLLSLLQMFLCGYLTEAAKAKAMLVALVFILIGLAVTFIGRKLRPKPKDGE